MLQLTPIDSRYIPLTQQPYCCVPTCIAMIMYRRGIPLLPQETIGHALGLAVPKKDQHLFWAKPGTKKGISGWGTRILEPQFEINGALDKLGIPLRVTFRMIDEFDDLAQFTTHLVSIDQSDKDALACFEWSGLYTSKYSGGHVAVIDRVDVAGQTVRLVDPDPSVAKWPVHPIDKLYAAMKIHGSANWSGFWQFELI